MATRELTHKTLEDGRKGFVETKYNVWAGIEKFEKGIYPLSAALEIGGERIILPNGKTTFLFWSDIKRSFFEA